MGYDLHITRQEHWADEETSNIPLDEWLAYVNSDKELELTKGFEMKIGSASQFHDRPGYCEWNAHPMERSAYARPWFDYWEGNIITKNPDMPTIRKMIQIASALHAKVQGDDGEFYNEAYLKELENEESNTLSKQRRKKPWWKFW